MSEEAASRLRESLFSSMPGDNNPPYKEHRWNGEYLVYTTDDDFRLIVLVSLEDTHEVLTEKLLIEYDQAREEREREDEMDWMEMGYHFLVLY